VVRIEVAKEKIMNLFFVRRWWAPITRHDPLAGCWFITKSNFGDRGNYELFRLGRVMGLLEPGRLLVKEIFDGSGDDYPPDLSVISSKCALDPNDEDRNSEEIWEFFTTRKVFLRELARYRALEAEKAAKAKAAASVKSEREKTK
jgi:hypothetical protein